MNTGGDEVVICSGLTGDGGEEGCEREDGAGYGCSEARTESHAR